MHVLILNQTFYPDVAATAQHMWDLARHLDAAGHRVTAVASRTVYGQSEQFDRARERIGRIEIHRVGQTKFGKRHTAGRLVDFLSFYVSAYRKLAALAPPDVILVLTSPPMIGLLGVLQKRFRRLPGGGRIRLVYHLMDLYPDAAVAMGVLKRRSIIARVMHRLTAQTLRACDGIIALGQDMRSRLQSEYALAQDDPRVRVIHPWADGRALYPLRAGENALRAELFAELHVPPGAFAVVYSGNLGAAHDTATMAGAIARTRDDASLVWLFIGGGSGYKTLKKQADTAGWPNVRFLPYQPRERLNASLNLAGVHLISQLPAFTGVVVPSKLFGILAVGKPSIMIGPADAEVSQILTEHQAGTVVGVGDIDGLLRAIDRFRTTPEAAADGARATGDRARELFISRQSGEQQTARIEQLLLDCVAKDD